MPDITMCSDSACPKRGECYRYLGTLSARQYFFIVSPRDGGDDCREFTEARGYRSVVSLAEADKRNAGEADDHSK